MRQTFAWVGVGLLAAAVGAAAAQTAARPPGAQTKNPAPHMRGKIVRVDPQKGVVVIRTGMGATAKDMEYRVANTTRYYGTDRKALTDGLKYSGFKEGAEVWYRMTPPATGTAPAPPAGTGGVTKPRTIYEIGFGRAGPAAETGGAGRKAPDR